MVQVHTVRINVDRIIADKETVDQDDLELHTQDIVRDEPVHCSLSLCRFRSVQMQLQCVMQLQSCVLWWSDGWSVKSQLGPTDPLTSLLTAHLEDETILTDVFAEPSLSDVRVLVRTRLA